MTNPNTRPARPEASPRRPRSRRNAPNTTPDKTKNRRAKRSPLPYIWLGVVLLCALILAVAVVSRNKAQAELLSLRTLRAEMAQRHQDVIAYYANMRRRSGVMDTIQRYANEYSVHPSLVSAVIARESSYDQYAQSGVGARGLMQIMEDTGEWIAGKLGYKDYQYDHLYDPDLNIRFGTWYLAYLSDQYGGNPVMVASAYHAGRNNVDLWALSYAEDERILSIDRIPKDDTRDYVQKVMNAYALYFEYDSQVF